MRLLARVLFFVLAAGPLPALAYIDPNAGGLLFQLLAPLFVAIVGGWLFLRRWIADAARRLWRRITGRASPSGPNDEVGE